MPRKRGPKVGDQTEMMTEVRLTIGESTIRMLRVLGNGNLSEGARRAARVAYDRYQTVDDDPDMQEMHQAILTPSKIVEAKAIVAQAERKIIEKATTHNLPTNGGPSLEEIAILKAQYDREKEKPV
jgi:hypothetical protein